MEKNDILNLGMIAAGAIVGLWLGLTPTIQAFVVLLAADVATGVLAGGKAGALDSDISFRGMRKKGMEIVLVGVCAFLGDNPRIQLPLGDIMAGGLCVTELMSIVENAGRLGITLPKAITDALAKLQPSAK